MIVVLRVCVLGCLFRVWVFWCLWVVHVSVFWCGCGWMWFLFDLWLVVLVDFVFGVWDVVDAAVC